jgi:hypothetical protein
VIDLLTILGSVLSSILVAWQAVHPPRSSGYAASVLGAVLALGLLAAVAKFATTKPKRRRHPPR